MHHESTHRPTLGERLTHLAQALAGCIAAAYEQGTTPPSAIMAAQRALDAWATAITYTAAIHTGDPLVPPRPGRRLTVVLLVDVTNPQADPHTVAGAIVTTAGPAGSLPGDPGVVRGRWRIVHAAAHPAIPPAASAAAPTTPEPATGHRRWHGLAGGGDEAGPGLLGGWKW